MANKAKSATKANTTPEMAAPAGSATTRPRRNADAEQECAGFHKKSGRIIKLITVQEILDAQHVP